MVNDVGTAHCPALGVNVYIPLALLLTTAGFQSPVIPLVDVKGSVGAVTPLQIISGVMLKVGTIFVPTVTLIVVS